MVKIVFTPDWFLNFDILIESFGFIILCLFFLFAVKSYRLSGKKSVLYLGLGFLSIALAELSTVFTKLILYYDSTVTSEIGQAIVTQGIISSVDIFYYTGFFFHRFFTLFGLYIIYKLPTGRKKSDPADFALTIYLILMTAILSHSLFYLYHLTAFIILGGSIRDGVRIYRGGKSKNTLILITAFSLLAISQAIFIFSLVGTMYVVAQTLQIVSYVILLALIIRITQNGKKEKQNRDHA